MTATLASSQRLVNIAQAAEYADVHPMTIRRWAAAGRLTAYRIGPRLIKVHLDDVDAMLSPIPVGDSVA